MQYIINGKQFTELTDVAAPGIKKNSYFINIDGEIYSKVSNRYINPTMAYNGYFVVNLKLEDGRSKVFYLHRLMMLTYQPVPNCESLIVNHKDGNKMNCSLENMEWTDIAGNNRHALQNGLIPMGEDCSWAILTEQNVIDICEQFSKGIFNIAETARKYNVSETTIYDLLFKRKWKHITTNYEFDYQKRTSFTDAEIHQICKIIVDNKDKTFTEIYYIIIYTMKYEDCKQVRSRLRKIYNKDPNNYYRITSQYNY